MFPVGAALLPLLLAAYQSASAADPFFFYAENAGQEAAGVKYRLNGVSQRAYLGVNAIHLRESFGQMALRFAAGAPAVYQSLERWPGIFNRFEGNPQNWRRGIPAHRRVQYTSIAPNVDALFGSSAEGLPTLTFVVRPGGDVNSLFLETDRDRTTLDDVAGTWTITGIPQWHVKKPRAWQELRGAAASVDSRFRTTSPVRVAFTIGVFDRSQPLYVEVGFPINSITATPIKGFPGAGGNSYAPVGTSSDRVCTVNPAGGQNLCPDAGMSGLRPNGEPIFLTILSGAFDDFSFSPLFRDRDGNVVLLGRTGSADFPVTADAHQLVNAGPIGPFPRLLARGGDLFISILNPTTGDLLYSTFLGGPNHEDISQSTTGSDSQVAILIGSTGSTGFPVTAGAWRIEGQVAVALFDSSLRKLRFATFVPVGFSVHAMKIASDPTTENALQPVYGGGDRDGYLVRLAPDGSRPLFATYFGGTGAEQLGPLDQDSAGNLWISASRLGSGEGEQENYLVHLSGDGSRLAGPRIPIPIQAVIGVRIASGGDLVMLGGTAAAAAVTTPGAPLHGTCNLFGFSSYFQVFRPDGTLRFASYLAPNDARGVDELYAEYLRSVGQPAINGGPKLVCVTSAASRRNSGSVSPGQIVTLLGAGLGPMVGVSGAPGQDRRYPTTLAGVRVFAGDVPVPLLYAESGQINAIMPYSIQAGKPVTVTVEYDGRRASAALNVIPAALQLFSLDASGGGPAVALNQDGSLNSRLNPAQRGSIVVVYGTGAGLTLPAGANGALAPLGPIDALPKPLGKVVLRLNGYSVPASGEILYAGAAPGLVNGLIQINFRLPDLIPSLTFLGHLSSVLD